MRRAAIIVLDGLGIGPAPDTEAYGDAGSDTLGNVARAVGGLRLPQLAALGLGHCADAERGTGRPGAPGGARHLRAAERGEGQHHRPLGDLRPDSRRAVPDVSRRASRTRVIAEFARRTGRGVLGNRAASGTAILDALGEEHQRTGKWIVYTSADSVFQVAAHEETVPLGGALSPPAPPRGSCCRASTASPGSSRGRSAAGAAPGSAPPAARTTACRRPGPTLLDRLAETACPAGRRGQGGRSLCRPGHHQHPYRDQRRGVCV